MEGALYEIEPMSQFAGLKLDRPPDETTIVKFRHFLAHHGLGTVLFGEVSKHREKNGLMLREDRIVDAIIISAPSSTKNVKCERDPEMHQTKKENQGQFGTDNTLGLIYRIDTMAANVQDIVLAGNLLHGDQQ